MTQVIGAEGLMTGLHMSGEHRAGNGPASPEGRDEVQTSGSEEASEEHVVRTILVVDDEFGVADVLAAALEDEGYRVVTAANGKQGIERLAESAARSDLG